MSYLILGASSGLGRELAYILAKNSNDLIIISRDERDLRAIKSDLEIKFKITVKYFVVDASSFDEVKKFCKMKVNKELSSNKIIGIKEIRDYLQGKITLIKTKELITQKTKQYAKRQFTWARGHMKSWEMIYSPNINDLFKKTINKIS